MTQGILVVFIHCMVIYKAPVDETVDSIVYRINNFPQDDLMDFGSTNSVDNH